MSQNGKIAQGLGWKLLERFGVLGAQFVLQILLARVLGPEHYGVLALMTIFTAIANSFIQHGFNLALVQNKDVTEKDFSSVFWMNLLIALGLYAVFFLSAPLIAAAYDMPELVTPFRVLCLMLIPGSINAIQIAKQRRKLEFKKVFLCNFAAVLVAGIISVFMAYNGAGLWALVAQNLIHISVACVIMWFAVDFRPSFGWDLSRIKVLFSYGWKLMLSDFLNVIYQDIRTVVIGLKYSKSTLGNYDQGKKFPQFLNNVINSAVQSVLLPAMSAEQNDRQKVKLLMRNSVMISSFLVFPMMAGLAGVATSLVQLLLTDAWLPCVPYLQICCFSFAFYPIHSSNLQAINAMGRSDIFLILEIIKKVMGMVLLVGAIFLFDSPIAIALTGIISTLINTVVNSRPNKKLIGYTYLEQVRDIFPSLVAALVMFLVVLCVQLLQLSSIWTMLLQILTGIVVYVTLAAVFRLAPFKLLLQMIRKSRKK